MPTQSTHLQEKFNSFDLKGAWFRAVNSARSIAFFEAAGSAAANFLISIFVARTYDAATFSGYFTALSAAFVAVAFLRFCLITPTAVKPDAWYRRRQGALAAVHIVSSLAVILFIWAVMLVLALVIQTNLWFAAALAAPGVCVWFVSFEFERSLLIKQSRHVRLLLISFGQAFAIAAVLYIIWFFQLPFEMLVAAMAAIGITRSTLAVSVAGTLHWRKGARHMRAGLSKLGLGAGAYLLGGVSCSHAPVFALSLTASPEQAAAFGAMRTLYQPVQVFFRSRDVVAQSRFHAKRIAVTLPLFTQFLHSLRKTSLLSIALMGGFVAVGPWLVHGIYAGRYDSYMLTFWLWAMIMLMINLATITDSFVSYAGLQGRYATVQIFAGLLSIALSFGLSAPYGDVGAAVSAICGWTVIVAGGALVMRKHGSKV